MRTKLVHHSAAITGFPLFLIPKNPRLFQDFPGPTETHKMFFQDVVAAQQY